MEKILLDTDIGSDIDDAVCLAYLLANPQCELLGITTVLGETQKRAELASAMVYQAGKQVPIFPGASRTVYGHTRPSEVTQHKALGGWKHDSVFAQGEWLEFMKHTIEANPGEVTLLAIGPMTNVGLLFAAYPELPGKLKSLVLMCGEFTDRFTHIVPIEWNARCDPYATAMVYDTTVSTHKSVGLDVTFQVNMSAEKIRKYFTHPILQPVLDYAGVWFEEADVITFHDPLTAVDIFHNDVLTFERGDVHVEISDPCNMGKTILNKNKDGRHLVAETVDTNKFFKHYFSVFGIDFAEA